MNKEIKFFNKLLRRMFGYKDYKEAIDELKCLEKYFLIVKKSEVSNLTMNDMNCTTDRIYFTKYKTLKKILTAYLECVEAVNFDYEEYKGEMK